MKFFVVSSVVVACVFAASVPSDQASSIVRSDFQSDPDGNYQYSYETDNGISSNAQGKVKVYGKDEVALEVSGSNSYISPEGQKVEFTYIANENGYQPQGALLPTPPPPQPIPDYIVRALEYIKAHPYVEATEKPYKKP
ncbi:larval cuticle protein LCP-14-like [Leptidea sinapis]|uniref:Uncharacterized protein n=1 Tax=Leptidea sinapis TaxID=189913 RepID=A0A5E4QDS4_9NEOP|nr:larval cuticle protein LCP-14-like [Leptidea sinapis]VVC95674.1 unnamed protein product [Leptidea sinapis]